ncbi:MAG: mechanosensitive ion channel [Bacteroidetes bacterium]|nr:mechanosensitive ion channel [Bacteroidota bacterium]MDA1122193.1 mechanosensitive ion channel [Bacteroidota bacterium]
METSALLDKIVSFLTQIGEIFSKSLFQLGQSEISLSTIIYFLLAFILLFYIAGKVKKILIHRVLVRSGINIGVRESIGMITKFTVISIGGVVIIQSVGIDLSALSLLAGALGVGIGFGLQNITNNLVSGIIILFENPIKVGDRIEVGGITGDVVNISVRATTVLTNDNISVIVPNSEFISGTVINWSHNDRNIRFNVPVGVSYKEDPEVIKKILLDVANENENVLKTPGPDVLFEEFGDSSLNFTLQVWTQKYSDKPRRLISELNFAIFEKFKAKGIEIPFPQRDLHIKTQPIEINNPIKKEI